MLTRAFKIQSWCSLRVQAGDLQKAGKVWHKRESEAKGKQTSSHTHSSHGSLFFNEGQVYTPNTDTISNSGNSRDIGHA